MEKPKPETDYGTNTDYYNASKMDAYLADLEAKVIRAEAAAKREAGDCEKVQEENKRMRNALAYVICCDVDPRTSTLTATSRLRLAAERARAVLKGA